MQWSKEKAWNWYRQHPWLCGFNYLPRTAVNYTDFWQSFDEPVIEQELGWARQVGFNSVRVVLSFLVWQADPADMRRRLARFLALAAANGLSVIPCPLDDCEFSGIRSHLGPQPAPAPGVHNSRANASPGRHLVMDRAQWPAIAHYVRDVVAHFAADERVLLWDLYNEPGNRSIFTADGERFFDARLEKFSLELMVRLFEWVRAVSPQQPLTVAGWHLPPSWEDTQADLHTHLIDLQAFALSDVISFHAYCRPERLRQVLDNLGDYGRPLFCTEWMARHAGSRIEEQLPIFAEHGVASYLWGLVNGKTQTHIPWPAVLEWLDGREGIADTWFHDVLHPDGSPYDAREVAVIARLRAQEGG